MKKIIMGLICLLAAFFFTGCGEPSDNGPHKPDTGGDIENPDVVKYTITVDLGDGETIDFEYNKGDYFEYRAPKKEGYVFNGYRDANGNNIGESFPVTQSMTIKAVYIKNIQVKFMVNGNVYKEEELTNPGTVSFPFVREYEKDPNNRIFKWYSLDKDNNRTYYYGDKIKVDEDITFYCVISKKFNDLYYSLEGDNAVIDSFHTNGDALIYPDEIEGHKVTKIDPHSCNYHDKEVAVFFPKYLEELPNIFESFNDISYISIPSSIKEIPSNTLTKKLNIETVAYAGSLEQYNDLKKGDNIITQDDANFIFNRSFKEYKNVTKYGVKFTQIDNDIILNIDLTHGDAVVDLNKLLPDAKICDYRKLKMDKNYSSVKHFTLHNSTKVIPDGLFKNNYFETLVLNEGLEYIGNNAFENNRLTSLVIPNSVNHIGDLAFFKSKIKEVNIPENVSYLGINPFADSNLKTITVDPKNKNYTYSNDNKILVSNNEPFKVILGLDNFYIPSDIKCINDYAFYGVYCERDNVNFPDLDEIGEYAFSNSEITNMNFTKIKNIKSSAFDHGSISSLSFDAIDKIEPCAFKFLSVHNIDIKEGNYYVKELSIIEKANSKLVAGFHKSSIPNGVKIIGEGAFLGAEKNTIILPSSVERIENSAFLGCNLYYIHLNDGLKYIGEDAIGLTTPVVSIPDSVEVIEKGGLSLFNLEYIYLPKNTDYKNEAIYINENDKSPLVIDFAGTKEEYDKYFHYSSYHDVNFNANNKAIFYDEQDFSYVEYQNKAMTVINTNKDALIIDLTSLNKYEETKFTDSAFAYCTYLHDIKLPNNLKVLSPFTFAYTNVKNVILPQGLTKIDDASLSGLDDLLVFIPKSCKDIISPEIKEGYIMYEGSPEEYDLINIKDSSYFTNKQNIMFNSSIESRLVYGFNPEFNHSVLAYSYLDINNTPKYIELKNDKIDLSKILAKYGDFNFTKSNFKFNNGYLNVLTLPKVSKLTDNVIGIFQVNNLIIPSTIQEIAEPLKNINNYSLNIYLNVDSIPAGFCENWNSGNNFYLKGQWEYNQYGEPCKK